MSAGDDSASENQGGSIGMVIFLAIATLAQVWFFRRGFIFATSSPSGADPDPEKKDQSKGVALTALAWSDLSWAAACFVHCAGNYSTQTFWGGRTGCQAQGFYSLLSCFSSFFFTAFVTYISYICVAKGNASLPSRKTSLRLVASFYAVSVLLSCIPFFQSTSSFVYLKEGFCFIDYSDHSVTITFITLLSLALIAVWGFTIATCLEASKDQESTVVRISRTASLSLVGFALLFTLYYILGYPLAFYGLSGESYPDRMQIASALLAHGAEVINPLIYGVFWTRWFISGASAGSKVGEIKEDKL